jgi:hypothetical protein
VIAVVDDYSSLTIEQLHCQLQEITSQIKALLSLADEIGPTDSPPAALAKWPDVVRLQARQESLIKALVNRLNTVSVNSARQ